MPTEALRLYDVAGKDGYPPEWHDTIKHAVRDDAEHRCVRCLHPYVKGAGEWSPCDDRCVHDGPTQRRWEYDAALLKNVEIIEARWRILTVHHLDGNKLNCRWWNLASLCQRCHLTIQGKVQMQRVWVWEHSDWFKPYVAGYYAWTYLGEDIDHATAIERLDELLALERAA